MANQPSCKDIEQHLKALLKGSIEKTEARDGAGPPKPNAKQKHHRKPDHYEDNFPALAGQSDTQKSSRGNSKRPPKKGQNSTDFSKQDGKRSYQNSAPKKVSRNKYKNSNSEPLQNGISESEIVDLNQELAAQLNSGQSYDDDPAVISIKRSSDAPNPKVTPNNVALQSLLHQAITPTTGASSGNSNSTREGTPNKEPVESDRNKNRKQRSKKKSESDKSHIKMGASGMTNVMENAKKTEREKINELYEVTINRFGEIVGVVNKTLAKEMEAEYLFVLAKQSDRFPDARFFCRLCSFHCDLDNVNRHLKTERHVNLINMAKKESLLRNLPSPTQSQTQVVGELIEKLFVKESLTDEDLSDRQSIVDYLNVIMKENAPELTCKFQIYGSSISRFGLKTSDVNIDMIVTAVEELSKVLSIVYNILIKEEQFVDVLSDFQAKIPRISFKHVPSNLICNISWNNTASLQTARLLANYAELDPRVLKLGVAIRYWAKLCLLDQQTRGTLPAHSFAILLIYFLQQQEPPVLPVLHEMNIPNPENPKSTEDPKIVDDLIKIDEPIKVELPPPWKSENDQSLGELWIDFLRFYSVEFMAGEFVVCIRRLLPLTRAERKWDGKVIAIEDPSARKRNLSRSISNQHIYRYILERFQDAYKYFGIPQTPLGPLYETIPIELYRKNWRKRTVPKTHSDNKASEGKLDRNAPNQKDSAVNKTDNKRDGLETDSSSDEEDFLEGQDPDLSFDDVADTLLNLRLDSRQPRTESESSDVITVDRQVPVVTEDKLMEISAPLKAKNSAPSPAELFVRRLIEEYEKNDFVYEFNLQELTRNETPPIYCRFCQREGHLCDDCPSQILPDLITLPTLSPGFLSCLDKSCDQVMWEYYPSEREVEDRKSILAKLEKNVRQLYTDAKLELFGSSCNGFGFVRSDMDICLTFAGNKTGEGLDYVSIIEALAVLLKGDTSLTNILAIKTAKVPIVKVTHLASNVECDISLYNTLAQHNTRMLKMYCKIDKRLQTMGYTMKLFAKLCDIGDASRGSLSSYAYILMVLHYLQQRKPPVIPVLQELYDKSQPKPEVIVDGWNAWFYDNLPELNKVWPEMGSNKESIGSLWLGLLRYYTEEFNFKESVITIRQIAPLSRFEKVWNSKSIAIEDPFDLNHNLGVGVSINMNTYIMKALIRGREIFGKPPHSNFIPKDPLSFFFNQEKLMVERPPNDHGCRICQKIGHKMKDCPNTNRERRNRRNNDHQDHRMRQQNQRQGGPNRDRDGFNRDRDGFNRDASNRDRDGFNRDGSNRDRDGFNRDRDSFNRDGQRDAYRDRDGQRDHYRDRDGQMRERDGYNRDRDGQTRDRDGHNRDREGQRDRDGNFMRGGRQQNSEPRPMIDLHQAVKAISTALRNPNHSRPPPGFQPQSTPQSKHPLLQHPNAKPSDLNQPKQNLQKRMNSDSDSSNVSAWPSQGSNSPPVKPQFQTHPLTGHPIGSPNNNFSVLETFAKNLEHVHNHGNSVANKNGQIPSQLMQMPPPLLNQPTPHHFKHPPPQQGHPRPPQFPQAPPFHQKEFSGAAFQQLAPQQQELVRREQTNQMLRNAHEMQIREHQIQEHQRQELQRQEHQRQEHQRQEHQRQEQAQQHRVGGFPPRPNIPPQYNMLQNQRVMPPNPADLHKNHPAPLIQGLPGPHLEFCRPPMPSPFGQQPWPPGLNQFGPPTHTQDTPNERILNFGLDEAK